MPEAAGAHTTSLSLQTGCNGAPLTINPGDTFVIAALLESVSNRGGFVDAMHTFSVAYDGDHTVFTGTNTSVGSQFFAGNFVAAGVPEPSAWMLMIGGFGLLGCMMRRRKVSIGFA